MAHHAALEYIHGLIIRGGGRNRVLPLVVLGLAGLALVLAGLYLTLSETRPPPPPPLEDSEGFVASAGQPLALIYDPLYREYPNEALLGELVSLLVERGYRVDVYRGVNATIEPLRSLGKYDLVIIRAHGGYSPEPEGPYPKGSYIYTGLLYTESYVAYGEVVDSWIRSGIFTKGVIIPPYVRLGEPVSLPQYLVATPRFFEEYVDVEEGSVIIYFGCFGLDDYVLADIFLSKGAKAFISWRGAVTVGYMDLNLVPLVEAYLDYGLDGVVDFIESTPPDPATGSELDIAVRRGG